MFVRTEYFNILMTSVAVLLRNSQMSSLDFFSFFYSLPITFRASLEEGKIYGCPQIHFEPGVL